MIYKLLKPENITAFLHSGDVRRSKKRGTNHIFTKNIPWIKHFLSFFWSSHGFHFHQDLLIFLEFKLTTANKTKREVLWFSDEFRIFKFNSRNWFLSESFVTFCLFLIFSCKCCIKSSMICVVFLSTQY